MTRTGALQDLLKKVEAGMPLDRPQFRKVFHLTDTIDAAYGAFLGSLDAAKALHEAVPTPGAIMDDETSKLILFAPNGARVWLAWKLKALIAKEQTDA